MTTFSYEDYLKGQPVITRTGLAVTDLNQLTYNNSNNNYITAIYNSLPTVWDDKGKYIPAEGASHALDLFMGDLVIYKYVLTSNIIDVEPVDLTNYTIVKIVTPE
jgi:hypothetical protein